MLVGCVVDDKVDDHPLTAVAGLVDELDEIAKCAEPRVDAVVVGDVVAVVAVRRRVHRVEPQACDTEAGEVVEAAGQSDEVADAVAVASPERSRRRGSR